MDWMAQSSGDNGAASARLCARTETKSTARTRAVAAFSGLLVRRITDRPLRPADVPRSEGNACERGRPLQHHARAELRVRIVDIQPQRQAVQARAKREARPGLVDDVERGGADAARILVVGERKPVGAHAEGPPVGECD